VHRADGSKYASRPPGVLFSPVFSYGILLGVGGLDMQSPTSKRGQDSMPGPSPHALIWSETHQHYELSSNGRTGQSFRWGDEPVWQAWLAEHTAFAFIGQTGRLSVLKEARSRGTGYWYAYLTRARHTHKHYLGPSTKVTFVRLEQVAQALESRSLSGQRVQTVREGSRTNVKSASREGIELFSPKLSRPRPSALLVERSRLLSQLEAVRSHPLTLVSASAGSGKTTLLSSWAALFSQAPGRMETMVGGERNGEATRVAWLSLDSLDNDPTRFWTSVIAALRTCLPQCGQRALAMLHSSESPLLTTVLMTFLQDLMEEDADIILILDDYHVISDLTIFDSLRFFIEHLPPQLHLIIASRTDPELPLARWRVHGQLLEIRDRDLRFTQEEAASFLRRAMGLSLSEGDVAIVQQRTEGWVAGLQLAGLSLRGKRGDLSAFLKEFAGSHRFLLDYVQQEILAQLPSHLQMFLLQTAIVERMNAAVCQAVAGLSSLQEGQDMLEALERANLFVVPLDDSGQWYRFQDLFREALRACLQASQPQLVPLLHLRAARFYESVGQHREAIAHALAAEDYSYAASLMEHAAESLWLSGEARTVQAWVLSLPDAVLRAHFRLALLAALQLLNSITIGPQTVHADIASQVERTLMRMDAIVRRKAELALSEAEVALIERRTSILRALLEVTATIKRGDQERLRLLALEIEALPEDEDARWNLISLTFTFWRTALLEGEGASLIPKLLVAKQHILATEDPLLTIRVTSWLAFAYLQAAQLHLAQQECLQILALIEQSGARTIMAGYAFSFLCSISYSWNRLEEAADWLSRLQRLAEDWHLMDLLVRGELLAARLALAKGDLASAELSLHKLESLIEQEGLANHTPGMIALRVQLWLAQGNLVEAEKWAAQTTLSPGAWNPLRKGEVLMLVRALLAQQRYSQALERLERESGHLDCAGDLNTALEFLALSAIAQYQAGNSEQATRIAARLLQLSEPEGHIRVYLDAGPPMKQVLLTLLQDRGETASSPAPVPISRRYVSRVLEAFEQEQRRAIHGKDTSQGTDQRVPNEPLSRQEQRVLQLLVAGQTYAEMAEALVVSPNTIKTQISSIYRKLGVSRRAEAIAASAHLHLL
jgi:ATP/maltotriose-dependent transcriptional regulator MalT